MSADSGKPGDEKIQEQANQLRSTMEAYLKKSFAKEGREWLLVDEDAFLDIARVIQKAACNHHQEIQVATSGRLLPCSMAIHVLHTMMMRRPTDSAKKLEEAFVSLGEPTLQPLLSLAWALPLAVKQHKAQLSIGATSLGKPGVFQISSKDVSFVFSVIARCCNENAKFRNACINECWKADSELLNILATCLRESVCRFHTVMWLSILLKSDPKLMDTFLSRHGFDSCLVLRDTLTTPFSVAQCSLLLSLLGEYAADQANFGVVAAIVQPSLLETNGLLSQCLRDQLSKSENGGLDKSSLASLAVFFFFAHTSVVSLCPHGTHANLQCAMPISESPQDGDENTCIFHGFGSIPEDLLGRAVRQLLLCPEAEIIDKMLVGIAALSLMALANRCKSWGLFLVQHTVLPSISCFQQHKQSAVELGNEIPLSLCLASTACCCHWILHDVDLEVNHPFTDDIHRDFSILVSTWYALYHTMSAKADSQTPLFVGSFDSYRVSKFYVASHAQGTLHTLVRVLENCEASSLFREQFDGFIMLLSVMDELQQSQCRSLQFANVNMWMKAADTCFKQPLCVENDVQSIKPMYCLLLAADPDPGAIQTVCKRHSHQLVRALEIGMRKQEGTRLHTQALGYLSYILHIIGKEFNWSEYLSQSQLLDLALNLVNSVVTDHDSLKQYSVEWAARVMDQLVAGFEANGNEHKEKTKQVMFMYCWMALQTSCANNVAIAARFLHCLLGLLGSVSKNDCSIIQGLAGCMLSQCIHCPHAVQCLTAVHERSSQWPNLAFSHSQLTVVKQGIMQMSGRILCRDDELGYGWHVVIDCIHSLLQSPFSPKVFSDDFFVLGHNVDRKQHVQLVSAVSAVHYALVHSISEEDQNLTERAATIAWKIHHCRVSNGRGSAGRACACIWRPSLVDTLAQASLMIRTPLTCYVAMKAIVANFQFRGAHTYNGELEDMSRMVMQISVMCASQACMAAIQQRRSTCSSWLCAWAQSLEATAAARGNSDTGSSMTLLYTLPLRHRRLIVEILDSKHSFQQKDVLIKMPQSLTGMQEFQNESDNKQLGFVDWLQNAWLVENRKRSESRRDDDAEEDVNQQMPLASSWRHPVITIDNNSQKHLSSSAQTEAMTAALKQLHKPVELRGMLPENTLHTCTVKLLLSAAGLSVGMVRMEQITQLPVLCNLHNVSLKSIQELLEPGSKGLINSLRLRWLSLVCSKSKYFSMDGEQQTGNVSKLEGIVALSPLPADFVVCVLTVLFEGMDDAIKSWASLKHVEGRCILALTDEGLAEVGIKSALKRMQFLAFLSSVWEGDHNNSVQDMVFAPNNCSEDDAEAGQLLPLAGTKRLSSCRVADDRGLELFETTRAAKVKRMLSNDEIPCIE